MVLAILGFGCKYLSFNNRVLKYANEAVLPFYILHQTVIVTIGFYIASWNASVIVKYLILSTLSFAVIVSIYDLLIKRNNWLRFLFGMRLQRPIVVYATTGTLKFSNEITISSSFTAECAKNAEASETLRGNKGFSHYSPQNLKWFLNYSFYLLYILFFQCKKDNR